MRDIATGGAVGALLVSDGVLGRGCKRDPFNHLSYSVLAAIGLLVLRVLVIPERERPCRWIGGVSSASVDEGGFGIPVA